MYTTGTHIESHYDHQLQTPYCTYLPQHQWIQSHHCVNVSEEQRISHIGSHHNYIQENIIKIIVHYIRIYGSKPPRLRMVCHHSNVMDNKHEGESITYTYKCETGT